MDNTVKGKDTSLGIEKENSSTSLLIVQSQQILAQSPVVGGPRPVGGQAAAQVEWRTWWVRATYNFTPGFLPKPLPILFLSQMTSRTTWGNYKKSCALLRQFISSSV